MAAKMIKSFLPDLVTAISDCILPMSDQCLAKGLISNSTYKTILESNKTGEVKSRILLQAVISSTETDSTCLDLFLEGLDQILPSIIKDKLLSEIREKQGSTSKSAVQSFQTVQLVPTEALPRETAAIHTKLLGRFEDVIRQHASACAQKQLFKERLKKKWEECESLKDPLTFLQFETQNGINTLIDMCETEITGLKAKITELENALEDLGTQVKRTRNTVIMETRKLFIQVVQHSQEQVKQAEREKETVIEQRVKDESKIKKLEHKLAIQERD